MRRPRPVRHAASAGGEPELLHEIARVRADPLIRNRSVGRQLVDDVRQELRESVGHLGVRGAGAPGELLNRARAEDLGQLAAGDREVLAAADPGADHVAEAVLREGAHEASEPAEARQASEAARAPAWSGVRAARLVPLEHLQDEREEPRDEVGLAGLRE